jgi:glycine/D-amino acid oxidase-like deaminating enzyme
MSGESADIVQVRRGCIGCSIVPKPRQLNPNVWASQGVERLYVAAGFSGHGFKLSPAVGRGMIAFIVIGREAEDFDVSGEQVQRRKRISGRLRIEDYCMTRRIAVSG